MKNKNKEYPYTPFLHMNVRLHRACREWVVLDSEINPDFIFRMYFNHSNDV